MRLVSEGPGLGERPSGGTSERPDATKIVARRVDVVSKATPIPEARKSGETTAPPDRSEGEAIGWLSFLVQTVRLSRRRREVRLWRDAMRLASPAESLPTGKSGDSYHRMDSVYRGRASRGDHRGRACEARKYSLHEGVPHGAPRRTPPSGLAGWLPGCNRHKSPGCETVPHTSNLRL